MPVASGFLLASRQTRRNGITSCLRLRSSRTSGSYQSQETACKCTINSLTLSGYKIGIVAYDRAKDGSLIAQCYPLSNEFRNFETVCGGRVGASVCEYGTSVRDFLLFVRPDGAFNESIEGFW